MVSQGNKQKQKLDDPLTLTSISKTTEFEDATKEVTVVPAPTLSNRPYTSDDLFLDGKHGCSTTEDSWFVMKTANIDLLKDVRNKEVIFRILADKIEELLRLKTSDRG